MLPNFDQLNFEGAARLLLALSAAFLVFGGIGYCAVSVIQ